MGWRGIPRSCQQLTKAIRLYVLRGSSKQEAHPGKEGASLDSELETILKISSVGISSNANAVGPVGLEPTLDLRDGVRCSA
jgi:hypothetical protein